MVLDRSVGDDVEKISVIETKTEIIDYYQIWQHTFLNKSKQTISPESDFAFSKNRGLFPGTKTRLRKRFVIK